MNSVNLQNKIVNLEASELTAEFQSELITFRRFGNLVTGLELQDAITLAKTILAIAEPSPADAEMFRYWEDKEDARHDATTSHFGAD